MVTQLSAEQISRANLLGLQRFRNAKTKSLKDTLGTDSLRSHQIGARGEFAAAQALGYPEPVFNEDFGKADLGGYIAVRCSDKWHCRLWVRPKDKPQYSYLLVTEKPGREYVLRGWLEGTKAKTYPLEDPGNYNKPIHRPPFLDLKDPKLLRNL